MLLLRRNGVFVTTEARYPYRMNSGVCRFDSIKASVPAQDQFSLRSPGCVHLLVGSHATMQAVLGSSTGPRLGWPPAWHGTCT